MASVHPQHGPAILPLAVADPEALIETIRASVIGDDEAVVGPFGPAASPTPTTRRPAAP